MSIFSNDEHALMIPAENGNEFDLKIKPLGQFCFQKVERSRYYSILWIQEGSGRVKYEFREHDFQAQSILFFSPYQPFLFSEGKNLKGVSIHFSGDFYCLEKHREETSCNGLLFNTIYDHPIINMSDVRPDKLRQVLADLQGELRESQLADRELALSYLKIFLIHATRIKKLQLADSPLVTPAENRHVILKELTELIDTQFRSKKSPAEYASLLNISPKALGKLVKEQFDITLTALIRERVIIEAKRELYMTDKLVKEIAWELGYEDPFYFSRMFKKTTGVSPEHIREHYLQQGK